MQSLAQNLLFMPLLEIKKVWGSAQQPTEALTGAVGPGGAREDGWGRVRMGEAGWGWVGSCHLLHGKRVRSWFGGVFP